MEIEEFSLSNESEEERKERIAKMKADLCGKWGSTREKDAGASRVEQVSRQMKKY